MLPTLRSGGWQRRLPALCTERMGCSRRSRRLKRWLRARVSAGQGTLFGCWVSGSEGLQQVRQAAQALALVAVSGVAGQPLVCWLGAWMFMRRWSVRQTASCDVTLVTYRLLQTSTLILPVPCAQPPSWMPTRLRQSRAMRRQPPCRATSWCVGLLYLRLWGTLHGASQCALSRLLPTYSGQVAPNAAPDAPSLPFHRLAPRWQM